MLPVVVRSPGARDCFRFEVVFFRDGEQERLISHHVVDESMGEIVSPDKPSEVGWVNARLHHEFSQLFWALRKMLEAHGRQLSDVDRVWFEGQSNGSVTAFVSD